MPQVEQISGCWSGNGLLFAGSRGPGAFANASIAIDSAEEIAAGDESRKLRIAAELRAGVSDWVTLPLEQIRETGSQEARSETTAGRCPGSSLGAAATEVSERLTWLTAVAPSRRCWNCKDINWGKPSAERFG
jgi:hypothetical protein